MAQLLCKPFIILDAHFFCFNWYFDFQLLAYLIIYLHIPGSTQASSVVKMKKTKSEVVKSKTNMSNIDVDKLAQKLNMMSQMPNNNIGLALIFRKFRMMNVDQ